MAHADADLGQPQRQLIATESVKRLLQAHSQRGWDRHQVALFAMDSCYLQLARDKHVQRLENIHPSEMAATSECSGAAARACACAPARLRACAGSAVALAQGVCRC